MSRFLRLAKTRVLAIVACSSLVACSRGSGGAPDASFRFDAGRPDAAFVGIDAGARRCTTAAQCDDGAACTIDSCGVGNVCEWVPVDEMCGRGEVCMPLRGCVRGCTRNEDCDDGNYCNGDETCAEGQCELSRHARDCDDGDPCTVDTCDTTANRCLRTLAAGCDAGVPHTVTDAGVASLPFDPARDYSGTFQLVPSQNSDCLRARFSISRLVFSTSTSGLRVVGDTLTLTAPSVPTDATFTVTRDDGCGAYELTGTFSSSSTFAGHWQAIFSGDCDVCPGQDASIAGARL